MTCPGSCICERIARPVLCLQSLGDGEFFLHPVQLQKAAPLGDLRSEVQSKITESIFKGHDGHAGQAIPDTALVGSEDQLMLLAGYLGSEPQQDLALERVGNNAMDVDQGMDDQVIHNEDDLIDGEVEDKVADDDNLLPDAPKHGDVDPPGGVEEPPLPPSPEEETHPEVLKLPKGMQRFDADRKSYISLVHKAISRYTDGMWSQCGLHCLSCSPRLQAFIAPLCLPLPSCLAVPHLSLCRTLF